MMTRLTIQWTRAQNSDIVFFVGLRVFCAASSQPLAASCIVRLAPIVMSGFDDPYSKLKPMPPTPAEELCVCDEREAIILCWAISDNPIRCADCNNEVTPECLKLPVEFVDDIASWWNVYGSFYLLWLDSKEYEDFARAELSNPQSPINKRGYLLREKLSAVAPCYYWWFQETVEEGFVPLENCPKCGLLLTENFGRLVCEKCKILVAN